jgi:FkbH-like protein
MPEECIRHLPAGGILLLHGGPASAEENVQIAIAATFTAEPVREALNFWISELDLPCELKFAPYNQVFQQLLDPTSVLSVNRSGMNVVLIRLEDWWHGAGEIHSGETVEAQERVERNAGDFVDAIKYASGNSKAPYLICFCPASQEVQRAEIPGRLFPAVEGQIAERLRGLSGTYVVTSAEILTLYPVLEYENARPDEISHVPYTRQFFHALGTMIARRFYGTHAAPHKVIALDCDNTLWQGVCGEDGHSGVKIGPGYRALQEFMLAQRDAGMLLCLCSKNNEEDVWSVFEQNSGMVLKGEHFVRSRINWQSKSESLRALSSELNLGLDSFIFLDDSPVECAEVEARCPEVLTLQLPGQESVFQRFLSHVWAFDHLQVTEEDRQRSALYTAETERNQLQEQSLSLEDFLTGLELQVEILPMTNADVPRVAQLTQRTNQFNFTGVRRTETEVEQLGSIENQECLVVRLRDRFGDYGLVGAMFFTRSQSLLDVDNVLLSCRALGRRVEHRMFAALGRIAQRNGIPRVRINFVPTAKNKPAQDFLESLGAVVEAAKGSKSRIEFVIERIAELSSAIPVEFAGWGTSRADTAHGSIHEA